MNKSTIFGIFTLAAVLMVLSVSLTMQYVDDRIEQARESSNHDIVIDERTVYSQPFKTEERNGNSHEDEDFEIDFEIDYTELFD